MQVRSCARTKAAWRALRSSFHAQPPFYVRSTNHRDGVPIHMPPAAAKPVTVALGRRPLVPGPVDTMRAIFDVACAAEKRQQQQSRRVGCQADRAARETDALRELRSKDWDSLHQLWWVCVKERNRLATEKLERARLKAIYGDHEGKERDEAVQKTMKAILDTLAERTQAYQEAYALASQDPSIDLSRTDGPQYTQLPYDPLEPEAEDDAPTPAKDTTSESDGKLNLKAA
ncbi:hypothetical protein OPT61_g1720 [Boeremia exigua]|uniref:Uncharacterized protein n=1 Tax=Boeremia exigua TaxID=749465 RepID=A0ACC2IPB3_9PLEO|nr:hypothetical protein OPT61_g1720 [Boeremia exigua]